MPKGRNKRKQRDKSSQEEMATTTGDHDSDSICSSIPDSVISDDEVCDELPGDGDSIDIQFQFTEHLDQLNDKNSKVRLAALSYLNHTLRHKIVVQHLVGRTETVIDVIIRGLKKVNGTERQELLTLISLLAVQLGDDYNEMCSLLQPVLSSLVHDTSISSTERSAALSTLSFCSFLLCQDIKQVELVLHECEGIFHSTGTCDVLIAAIKGWSLLISIIPNHMIPAVLSSQLVVLSQAIQTCSDLTLKIAIGQAIALLFELARETDEELLESEPAQSVCTIIQSIASESNRYTGKRERTHQRASFKDISQALEMGHVPERNIKFGMESLSIDSWSRIVQYSTVTDLLATGCRTHLVNNSIIREVFQLGLPVIVHQESKADKIERKLYNAASAKWRSQSRGKQRDKRTVM